VEAVKQRQQLVLLSGLLAVRAEATGDLPGVQLLQVACSLVPQGLWKPAQGRTAV
jgi:hypothetical protein